MGWYIMGYEPDTIPFYIEIRNFSYIIKLKIHFTQGYYFSRLTSWSHHLIVKLHAIIHSTLLHSLFIGQQATWFSMVACHILIYSLIGQGPAASSASVTGDYSNYPSSLLWDVIFAILRATWWCKPSNTFGISPVINQILISYSITNYATTL